MKFVRQLRALVVKIARSGFATSIPLFLYLCLSSLHFLSFVSLPDGLGAYPLFWNPAASENEAEKYQAELLRQKFQFAGYGLSMVLILFCLLDFFRFWLRERTLLVLFFVILLTALVSDNPVRVVTNLIHLVFGVIATWLYFSNESRRIVPVRSAAFIVLYALTFVQLVSFIRFFAHPDGSIEAILSGKRTGGLSGNPNSLGGVCIVSAWAVLTLIFTQNKHRISSLLLWAIPVTIVGFNAWTTGSATTFLVISGTFALLAIDRFYGHLSHKKRTILLLTTTVAIFGILFWLVIEQNSMRIAEVAADSVGKDLTFSGRLDLWLVALEAIAERPLLGWSYDNHTTIMDNPLYAQPYNHFHNGFLDILIVGGLMFGIAVLVNFIAFATRIQKINSAGIYVFPLVAGVIAASVQNMTEYSMFRNNSAVWQLYFICFMAVAVQFTGRRRSSRRTSSRSDGAPRSRRRSRKSRTSKHAR